MGEPQVTCVHCGRAASRHGNVVTCAWCQATLIRCQDAQAPNGWKVRVWAMEPKR